MDVPRKYWWVAIIVVPIVIAAIPVVPQFFASKEAPPITKEDLVAAVVELQGHFATARSQPSSTGTPEEVPYRPSNDDQFSRFNPEIQPSRQLEALLGAFADDFESQKWLRLLELFDPSHVNAQLEMYLQDDFMFEHLGEPGQRSQDVVIKLYLYETLNMQAPDGPKAIEDVRAIYFTDMREEFDGYWMVSFTAEREPGEPLNGSITVDKDTLRFLGAWG
ncbi:MAG: hypothetical protein GY791_06145 [Alphaproteobacteria bacterium]|nr:hypothetical protein [Alphaproteobacteria bacterium]